MFPSALGIRLASLVGVMETLRSPIKIGSGGGLPSTGRPPATTTPRSAERALEPDGEEARDRLAFEPVRRAQTEANAAPVAESEVLPVLGEETLDLDEETASAQELLLGLPRPTQPSRAPRSVATTNTAPEPQAIAQAEPTDLPLQAALAPVEPSSAGVALAASGPELEAQPATVQPLAVELPVAGLQEARPQVAPESVATPAPESLPREAAELERAAEVLRQVRVGISPNARRATIELDPPELGRISVHLAINSGKLRGVVRAESALTLEMLERHVPELRAALAQGGLEAESLELRQGFGDASERGRDAFPSGSHQERNGTRASNPTRVASNTETDADHTAGLQRYTPSHAVTDGIDTYA